MMRSCYSRAVGCVALAVMLPFALGGASPLCSQELTGASRAAADRDATKWLLIVCGHPGDEEHRELFADSVTRIRGALTGRSGFDEKNVLVWFGTDDQDGMLVDCRGPAMRETLAKDVDEFRAQVGPDDELWVVVIGHAHSLGRSAQLNLPGPDVTADEFGEWFAEFECDRSVFFITTPLSGYFLKPLAKEGRVVISATEADLEVNETLYPTSLAEVLESFPASQTHDVDGDGAYSLLDLYLAVAQHVDARYAEEDLLATEHAQLDDNADGRGSELQLNYAESDEADPPPRPSRVQAGKDGELAASIDLSRALNATPQGDQP